QLVDRRRLEQVALVDRLAVDDAATGNHEGDEGGDQEFAHGEPQAGDRADDTLTAPVAVARGHLAHAPAASTTTGIPAFRRAHRVPGSRFGRGAIPRKAGRAGNDGS